MNDFFTQITVMYFTKHPQARADLQSFLLIGIEVQKAQRHGSAVIRHPHHQLPAWPKGDFGVDDVDLELCRFTDMRIGNSADAGFVFVAQRQMNNEICVAAQTQARQLGDQGVTGCGFGFQSTTRIASASTKDPRGSSFTPIAARAGKGCTT